MSSSERLPWPSGMARETPYNADALDRALLHVTITDHMAPRTPEKTQSFMNALAPPLKLSYATTLANLQRELDEGHPRPRDTFIKTYFANLFTKD